MTYADVRTENRDCGSSARLPELERQLSYAGTVYRKAGRRRRLNQPGRLQAYCSS